MPKTTDTKVHKEELMFGGGSLSPLPLAGGAGGGPLGVTGPRRAAPAACAGEQAAPTRPPPQAGEEFSSG